MRTVAEWRGRSDDAMPPPNVTLRIWQASGGKCACCGRKIALGEKWDRDHIVPLADGGKNVESNFQVLCGWCHKGKTAAEATTRGKVRAKAKAALGISKRKGRGFQKPAGVTYDWSRGRYVRDDTLWQPGNSEGD
jgi:5-methylcytosine-specific restriction enzyme A